MKDDSFSYSVLVRDVPDKGRRYTIEADERERQAVATVLGIPEVRSLVADLEVRPIRGQALNVRGVVEATVAQSDVVTLELVTQQVREDVDVTLMPAEGVPRSRTTELLVDVEEADGPDLYHNGRIDLAVIAMEHLALGLDPYPRAPETTFAGYIEDDPGATPSPFAALAGLKKASD